MTSGVQHGQVIARPLPGRAVVLLDDGRRVSVDVHGGLLGAVGVGTRARVTLGSDGRPTAVAPGLAARAARP